MEQLPGDSGSGARTTLVDNRYGPGDLCPQQGPGRAREADRRYATERIDAESIRLGLNRRIFPGDSRFVERTQRMLGDEREDVRIPIVQRRRPAPSLAQLSRHATNRDAAIVAAHATGEYGYTAIGAFFGLHFTTIGRIVRKAKTSDADS